MKPRAIVASLLMTWSLAACAKDAERGGDTDSSRMAAATDPVGAPGARHPLASGDTCIVTAGPGVPSTNAELGVPPAPAGARGLVTQVTPLDTDAVRILVEDLPADEKGRDASAPRARFDVMVLSTAHVMQRVGHRAAPGLLAVCQSVSVWFDGPLMESEPARGTAGAVVIERMLERRAGAPIGR